MLCSYCYTPFWMLKRYLFCSLYFLNLFTRISIYNFMFRFLISGNDKQYLTALPLFVFCMWGCISNRGCICLFHYFLQFFLVLFLFHLFVVWLFCNKRQSSTLISSQTSFLVQFCQDDTVSHKHVFTAVPQMLTSCSFLAQTQFSVVWGRFYGLEYASS